MKKQVFTYIALALMALQACKKDRVQPGDIHIPEDPIETTPVTGETQPSKENIVYRKLNSSLGYNKHIFLDANADGVVDISFSSVLIMHDGTQHLYLSAYSKATTGNRVYVQKGDELVNGGLWTYPFSEGQIIEPTEANNVKFTANQQKAVIMSITSASPKDKVNGLWVNQADKYLGFALKIDGEPHFGWVKLSHVTATNEIKISEYAYNKNAGDDIRAGEK
ncbi:hypothetical protein D0C36_14450 [Mucilaginibacter conchicola]|uniref:Uncharacterized protein n=1 Tax=Mucilaginibacter conchicola TaxID=2303333 RepID=A0A372NTJ9_9SPHI|nr:hypothetical protein [Mucilaginibacter conchicola]RFZ92613.1 hypothetical protein D0C36_14450 [Mucilaginibacter conchicola]